MSIMAVNELLISYLVLNIKLIICLLKIKNQNKQTCPWLPFPVGGKDYYKIGCDLKLSLWVRFYAICNPLTKFSDINVKEHKYACKN